MPHGPPLELNRAVPGGRVELYALRDEGYPGGWVYRFQYYHPEDGEILRYDNAHNDDDLGWHHRHVHDGADTAIEFRGLVPHVTKFLTELAALADANTEGANP